ncbi:IS4 family transposase [Azotobacter chroococcum]|uniref:IS4 family transposase n=1 Tax=Azotobacter chroococcum TaxID=353 RepID=UPI001038FEC5|nr:IS4 family transposase [Azotobacter chroococcum]TBW33918.1 IS4 family transposase [Azotobacter chroococcum]
MQTVQFLHAAFAKALPTIHARRLEALMAAVAALLQGRCLTLTALGRSLPGSAWPRHAIKRIDRLLGNRQLQAERGLFYWVMLRALLGSLRHPLILVDWSPIDAAGKLFLLRAAIPLAGRSLPVCEVVHPREGCPRCQKRLLEALAAMLPAGCRPVLVTDAGFRRPWFQAVETRGWHYVGRVRNCDLCRLGEQPWGPVKSLYALASASPKRLGCVEMTRSAPWSTQLCVVRHAPRGRQHRRITGTLARDKRSRQSAQREREPWLLASNLPEERWNAAQVVAIYKRRMQIEEGFRDLKSHRLGIGLGLHRSRCPRRIEILLLIAVLANYALCLLGLQAREAGHERRFQSNSLKCKRVLSLWRLGLEYARTGAGAISRETLRNLELALRREVHRQAQELG